MGSMYLFFCPKCGYSAEVSGGDDLGIASATTTVVCDSCREICDVETSKTPQDTESMKDVADLECPACGGQVKKWEGQRCPHCNTKMANRGIPRHWD
jgi:Zn finger protein HypA/HybF involved in hydrogenase expression